MSKNQMTTVDINGYVLQYDNLGTSQLPEYVRADLIAIAHLFVEGMEFDGIPTLIALTMADKVRHLEKSGFETLYDNTLITVQHKTNSEKFKARIHIFTENTDESDRPPTALPDELDEKTTSVHNIRGANELWKDCEMVDNIGNIRRALEESKQ